MWVGSSRYEERTLAWLAARLGYKSPVSAWNFVQRNRWPWRVDPVRGVVVLLLSEVKETASGAGRPRGSYQ